MKNITVFFFAFFFLAFFNAANGQSGGQSPVSGLGYAPDSNHVIISKLYRGRNGVAVWMHKDSINWGINSGNVFYISTNGDNSTGKKGYMDLPFHPQIQFDSFANQTFYWWYPGIYNIGPGQEYNYNFSNTGTPPPNWMYAPNSKVSVIETGTQDYIFKTTATRQTDTAFYFNIGELNLYDIAFCRTSEASPVGEKQFVVGRIGTLSQINPDISGDAVFVLQNSIIHIDSLSGNGQVIYAEPRHGDKNILSIIGANLNATPYPSKITTAFASATFFNTLATNPYFELNVKRGRFENLASVFWNSDAGIRSSGGVDILNFDYLSIIDTTNRIDTLFSATPTTPVNNANTINGLTFWLSSTFSNNYSGFLNVKEIKSDDLIRVRTCQDSFKINIDIKKGDFSQSRAIVIDALSNDNGTININFGNVICRNAAVVSVLSTDATTDITISGRMETQQPRQPVIFSAQNIILENAELINDGIVPAIQAPSPITVYIRGDLYMNSDSIDPDVTFRKIEYGYSYPRASQKWDTQTIIDSLYLAFTSGTDENGIISALPAGNVAINAASHNFDITSAGNITQTGSGSATYRFNLYPSSSLPVLLEQTSAGDTAYLQLRASLGRATLRATQDIYLEAANSVFVSTLEGSSTGIVSAKPTGELIRRERAFVNASINTDTFTVALSPTEINLTFNDDVSEGFNVSGDSLVYTGTDTAYFEIGYYQDIEFLESATGTYRLNLSVYQNGVNIPRSEMEHLIYYTTSETEPILTAGKTFMVQLINGDVLNIRQSGTNGINAAIHNLSITANKIE